jgi:hypothetical protein
MLPNAVIFVKEIAGIKYGASFDLWWLGGFGYLIEGRAEKVNIGEAITAALRRDRQWNDRRVPS